MSTHHTAIKKIYVDSRFRTDASASSSDFKISLPESVNLPENTKFFIDDIAIPHAWYSVETGMNDKFYMEIEKPSESATIYAIIDIPAKNYTGSTLAAFIKGHLNGLFTDTPFEVTYNEQENNITIASTSDDYTFKVLTRTDIKTKVDGKWNNIDYDVNNPADANTQIFKLYSFTSPVYDKKFCG